MKPTSRRQTIPWALLAVCVLVVGVFLHADAASAGLQDEIRKQTSAFVGSGGAELELPRDPRLVVAYTIQILLGLVGTIFIAYLVYAGYVVAFSGGEEDKINTAKATIRRSIIGIVIILSAYSITLYVAKIATRGQSQFDEFYEGDSQIDPNKGVVDTLKDFVVPDDCELLANSDDFLANDPRAGSLEVPQLMSWCEQHR